MRINTKKVALGMPPGLYEALEKLASEKKYTVPGYIRWLLWKHVDEKEMAVSLFDRREG